MPKSVAKIILFLVISISVFLWLKPFENEISMKNERRETGGKEAQEFFEQMIRNPKTGKIPIESLVSISNKMQKDARSSRKANLSKGVATTIWQERGGSNIQGRLKCIMIDKRDATGNTLIVGSDTGGLWKTTNAMSNDPTWHPINDFMSFLHTQSVFQNPANLNEIYCTTGNISWVSPETAGVGLYKSTDGGDTWNHLAATNNGNFKHSGNVVVNSSGIIFVATHEGGVQRSSNGGLTWSKVLGSGVGGGTTNQILDLDLATNGTLYATAKDKKVYKSSDNGNSWTNISIPGLTTNDYLIRLAVAPSDPNKVYAFVEWSKNFLSTNGGVSWTRVGDMSINTYGSSDGCITMEVDPNNSNRIYAGGINYNASSDSGTSWSRITGYEVHVDAHAITFLNSNVAFIGNDGGIYRTDNASSTNPTFKFIGNGLNTLQYYNIDIHPETYKDYFLGGTQDNGTQRSIGAGITSSENVLGGDGGFAFIDEDQPNIQIAAYQNEGGAYTTDNWNSSKYVGYAPVNQAYFITPKDYDDVNNRLYTCMSIANSYSVTTGIGIVDPVTVSTKTINAMNGGSATCAMVSPNDPNIVYFGCGNGALVKVVNPTATTPTATRIMDGAYGWISSIAVEPGNENHIIATYSSFGVNHIVETKNGGNSWMNISNNFPDMPVYNGIFAPNDTNKFILATHLGVWMTENLNGANTNWVSFNDGLSNVIVRMVKARKSDGVVVAGTHGRGLFTTNYFLQSDIAPSTPGTVFATNATSTILSLTWEASIDDLAVTGYDVYDGTTLLASVNTNSAEITGLSPDTTYSLTVKAKDGQGNISSPSSPALITTAATNSMSSNIALKASNVTTSFVSGWESLAAVNDGFTPTNSGDRTHSVYGNWDTHNTFQWVQYDWSQNYEITSVELYWFTDNGGILIPTEAFVEYYNGSAWVKLADVTLNANQFNIATFNTITASNMRVSMKNTTQSTGIIEFRVIGKIASGNMLSKLSLSKKLTKSVSVYPNPTSDKITLRLGDLATSGQLNLSILDVSGKLIWSKKTEGKNEISLYTQDMKLSKGIYLLRVSNTEVVQTIKIVISR
ncbi:Chitinase A1 precursor [Mariniflexile rhizosphaerae]|uniref:T9SS type A sorting domain-containing protein n=1 Tax=unclassified Mariniflexile TaxID=2643887 RepID=UPI000CAA9A89|nr:T9SS type A sorting domain-containing protein [Mariniflexile sp. TRM1-10]AXP82204.1 Chitinase A1 precursor [Mariniflexile sp. TRM1-10]PLB19231.1 MAG: BNR/Asp-box repeat domain protein [Flavobacteriaceae bacterium FS1-H7996/R]